MKESLDERLQVLSKELKKELMNSRYAKDEKSFRYEQDRIKADLVVKDLTTLDEFAFFDHFEEHALNYCKFIPDPSKIEEAYLNGELTDADLRAIRKPKFVTALSVEVKDV